MKHYMLSNEQYAQFISCPFDFEITRTVTLSTGDVLVWLPISGVATAWEACHYGFLPDVDIIFDVGPKVPFKYNGRVHAHFMLINALVYILIQMRNAYFGIRRDGGVISVYYNGKVKPCLRREYLLDGDLNFIRYRWRVCDAGVLFDIMPKVASLPKRDWDLLISVLSDPLTERYRLPSRFVFHLRAARKR